jgi:hypothetical protein
LNGRPTKVKSGVDATTGARYIEALERIGVCVRLEPETLELDTDLSASRTITRQDAAFAVERAELLRLLPRGSENWELLEGHELEAHSGERVRVVTVQLRDNYEPLISVVSPSGVQTGQYNLQSLGDDGQFVRAWIDRASGAFIETLRKQDSKRAHERAEAAKHAELVKQREHQRQSAVLKASGIELVEHITHADNVATILAEGFYARNKISVNFEDIADAGANARRDRMEPVYKSSIHSYVPFFFNAANPMLFARRERLPDLVILNVSAKAIVLSGQRWLISDGNAASEDTNFYPMADDAFKLDWACIRGKYWHNIADGKRKRCAEMLVDSHVPAEWIVRIDCFTQSTMERVVLLAEHLRSISVILRHDPFH